MNNIIGTKIGALTVLSQTYSECRTFRGKTTTHPRYICKCNCGKEVIRRRSCLLKKKYPACSNECRRLNTYKDIHIGQQVNDVTVCGDLFFKWKTALWPCLCPCGKITNITHSNLLNKNTNHCISCSSVENLKQYNSKKIAHNKLPDGEAAFNTLYRSYFKNAQQRELSFDLDKDVFKSITKMDCHYCGQPPNNHYPSIGTTRSSAKKTITQYQYNGIDRVNSKLGYSIDNCVPACSVCNYMKKSLSFGDFKQHIARIYKNLRHKER
jgi:hypothetical protein